MYSKYGFEVRKDKKIRVIIDTDAGCEADDQYAIAHALLTPKFEVKGITAEQFVPAAGDRSVDIALCEINRILKLMEITDIPVAAGAYLPLENETDAPLSPAAEMIISEAEKDDEKPLYLLCQGALTNVASALNRRPDIAGRFICIWIGGCYPDGGWEFNLINDFHAANAVFRSGAELWQVPVRCYSRMLVSCAVLQDKVRPYGKIGEYLFSQLAQRNAEYGWISGESWILGDSPVVGLAIDGRCGEYRLQKAPVVNENGMHIGETENMIRVYKDIDSHFILEDFFAKLRINYS